MVTARIVDAKCIIGPCQLKLLPTKAIAWRSVAVEMLVKTKVAVANVEEDLNSYTSYIG